MQLGIRTKWLDPEAIIYPKLVIIKNYSWYFFPKKITYQFTNVALIISMPKFKSSNDQTKSLHLYHFTFVRIYIFTKSLVAQLVGTSCFQRRHPRIKSPLPRCNYQNFHLKKKNRQLPSFFLFFEKNFHISIRLKQICGVFNRLLIIKIQQLIFQIYNILIHKNQ